jgi:ribosome-associated protein
MHVLNQPTSRAGEIRIPLSELSFHFARSGGPGGQNVNKVETKVTLSFDIKASRTLSEEQKAKLLSHPTISQRLHEGSNIRITSQVHNTQGQNKQETIERLHRVLAIGLEPAKERIPGGRPPHLKFPPSEHRKRQERREEQRVREALKDLE